MPSLVPPDRNVASCFFSEQPLGRRHTVLGAGGRNTGVGPDVCLPRAWILTGSQRQKVTRGLQIIIIATNPAVRERIAMREINTVISRRCSPGKGCH